MIGNSLVLAGRAVRGAVRSLIAAALALTCLFAADASLAIAAAADAQVRSHDVRARWRSALLPDFPEIVVADLVLPNERPGSSGDDPDAKAASCWLDEPAPLRRSAPAHYSDASPPARPAAAFDPRGPPRSRVAA